MDLHHIDMIDYVGIDFTPKLVQTAQELYPEADFRKMDVQNITFDDNSFDIVCMCEVIEHVAEPARVLTEVKRIIKPGGKFIISFPNYLHPLYLAIYFLSKYLKHPHWIDLQVVDRILFYPKVKKMLKLSNFCQIDVEGTTYGHSKIPLLRLVDRYSYSLTKYNLSFLSFHPVILLSNNK